MAPILKAYGSPFHSEQEAQLSLIASHHGTDAEQVVKETINRMLENQAHFLAGVMRLR